MPQIDGTTTFLNDELEKEVCMKQPEGFIEEEKHLVCQLKKTDIRTIVYFKHAGMIVLGFGSCELS